MGGLFKRLFQTTTRGQPVSDAPAENPVAVAGFTGKHEGLLAAAGAWEGEVAQAEYENFWRTFCHKPDVKFSEMLDGYSDDPHIDRLKRWLRPETLEPEPKAFIRLVLKMQAQGTHFWEEEGVTLFLKKRLQHQGGPSPESAACISLLAQVLGKSISYKHPQPDSELIQVLEFTP